jgi:branched-chain amino acid transport system permease protein
VADGRGASVIRFIGVLAGLAVLAGLPAVLPIYWTLILTEVLIMALFAMSFNLLFGSTGLLSFGQGGIFGVGAYTAALMLRGGIESLPAVVGAGTLAGGLIALLVGWFCVRRDEIFFAMITLAFGMMLFTVAHNWRELTGGSDGLPVLVIPSLRLGGAEVSLYDPAAMYWFVLGAVTFGALILWRVVRSPFGLMLAAVRENKERLAFVGAHVGRVRLMAFVLAGAVAGLCGVLFSLFNAMATPDFMHWGFSARPVMMTILGGSGVFFGPAFGAAVFFALEQAITEVTDNWMIILGGILIPVVIFFPRGILGTLIHWVRRRRPQ